MSNSPLSFKMEASPGSDIGDCFDQALALCAHLNCNVTFDFNEVFCGVRPYDVNRDNVRDIFIRNFQRELGSKGCKICYANP